MLHPGQHIHIVGVGGFGMSPIARVLLQQGYKISGSDLRENDFTRELAAAGATIYQGQRAENIAGADLVVATSAATTENPEIAAAVAQNIPVLRRRDMLGELMVGQIGIAVAGTHGKTTTTSLMIHTLSSAGRDPSYIVGGVMQNTGTNAAVGQGGMFVIEADEYDHMFLGLRPQIEIITNIEHDHPDCFPTLRHVTDAFDQFVERLPDDGLLITCADDPIAWEVGEKRRAAGHPVILYGLKQSADWSAVDLTPDAHGGISFTVQHGAYTAGPIHLNLAGQHNVLNALAVIAAADHLGVTMEQIAAAFTSFLGTGRRSEDMGRANDVTVINDYAHHPTAIRVTLAAHRDRPGVRDVWAVWQPHTYGRMRTLADDFAQAFSAADHVLVTDVYSVREKVEPGLDAAGMVDMIRATGHPDAVYSGSLDATAQMLIERVQPGDLVLLLSAGDAPRIGTQVLEALQGR
jgi:UDP-N-acetylmuramate--alanine ligase